MSYLNQIKVSKEYKDKLFIFLFGREENKEWTLSLYNAVNGSDYKDASELKFNTIENVLYMSMHNDVSFILDGCVNLYEQQSSFNPNMPVRMFQYLSQIYQDYIKEQRMNKYGSRSLKLPAPKLVVFYNGKVDEPDESVLKLTDCLIKPEASDVQVNVRMVNINKGHSNDVLSRCNPLMEYAWFVDFVRESDFAIQDAVSQAIDEMPNSFSIKRFLAKHKAEVSDMLETEYNEAEVKELFKEEGRIEGHEEGLKEGREEGLSVAVKFAKRMGADSFEEIYDLISSNEEYKDVTKEELQRIMTENNL